MRRVPISDDGNASSNPEQAGSNGALLRALAAILWPSFLVAGGAETLFFTLFDPRELHFFGAPLEASRTAIYSIGFFTFWVMAAVSSAITLFMARPAGEVNRAA